VTINLAPSEAGSGGENKIHYATLAFAITTTDQPAAGKLESIRPLLQDKMISLVGKRGYQDLTSVQGRYLLRTQLRELANQLAKEPLVTDVYFTEFVVQ
jgi:flagellar FliL protein